MLHSAASTGEGSEYGLTDRRRFSRMPVRLRMDPTEDFYINAEVTHLEGKWGADTEFFVFGRFRCSRT